jgi:pterin-4a-carbinolamine dehydratase
MLATKDVIFFISTKRVGNIWKKDFSVALKIDELIEKGVFP